MEPPLSTIILVLLSAADPEIANNPVSRSGDTAVISEAPPTENRDPEPIKSLDLSIVALPTKVKRPVDYSATPTDSERPPTEKSDPVPM